MKTLREFYEAAAEAMRSVAGSAHATRAPSKVDGEDVTRDDMKVEIVVRRIQQTDTGK